MSDESTNDKSTFSQKAQKVNEKLDEFGSNTNEPNVAYGSKLPKSETSD